MINTLEIFKINIESVEKLINFDREVMDIALSSITSLRNTLTQPPYNIENPKANGTRTLEILSSIRNNDSLKSRYSIINNQAVVLLVSYFAAAVADLFRAASKIAVEIHKDTNVLSTELKIKVEELFAFGSNSGDAIGDLLISKNSISFQDMKSIQREFKKYFGIKIEKDKNVNNIILGQACRHTIAHEAGIVNLRVLNQISGAKPRDLKHTLSERDVIEFTENEIKIVSDSMESYVSSLQEQVVEYSF